MRTALLTLFSFGTLLINAQTDSVQIYQLKVIASSKASVHCYINGFPVFEACSFSSTASATPINLYLTGKSNLMVVTLDGDNEEISAEGDIALYKNNEMVDARDKKPGVAPFSLTGENQNKVMFFTAKGSDFSYLFKQAPTITDEQKVREYAKHLLQLAKDKDSKAIAKEMVPKFTDYAKVYGNTETDLSNQFEISFINNYLNKIGSTPHLAPAIELNPLCEKRIYEITCNNEPFFKCGGYTVPVYVAMVNGELKIVR